VPFSGALGTARRERHPGGNRTKASRARARPEEGYRAIGEMREKAMAAA
jgi:hypothetical protein